MGTNRSAIGVKLARSKSIKKEAASVRCRFFRRLPGDQASPGKESDRANLIFARGKDLPKRVGAL
jgi:hypothetical protein